MCTLNVLRYIYIYIYNFKNIYIERIQLCKLFLNLCMLNIHNCVNDLKIMSIEYIKLITIFFKNVTFNVQNYVHCLNNMYIECTPFFFFIKDINYIIA